MNGAVFPDVQRWPYMDTTYWAMKTIAGWKDSANLTTKR
jgi:hypothetical protein